MEWQCNNKEIQPFPVRAYLNSLYNINTMFLLVTAQYTIQLLFMLFIQVPNYVGIISSTILLRA